MVIVWVVFFLVVFSIVSVPHFSARMSTKERIPIATNLAQSCLSTVHWRICKTLQYGGNGQAEEL